MFRYKVTSFTGYSCFQVVTRKNTVAGDMFRYANEKILLKVWKERMEAEYDSYPEVKNTNRKNINFALSLR